MNFVATIITNGGFYPQFPDTCSFGAGNAVNWQQMVATTQNSEIPAIDFITSASTKMN